MIGILLRTAVLGLMAGISAAVPAAAAPAPDIDGYLQTMHTAGWHDSAKGDVGLVEVGFKICGAVASGESREAIAAELHAANSQIDISDDRQYVETAVRYLCPDKSGYVSHESGDEIFYGVIV